MTQQAVVGTWVLSWKYTFQALEIGDFAEVIAAVSCGKVKRPSCSNSEMRELLFCTVWHLNLNLFSVRFVKIQLWKQGAVFASRCVFLRHVHVALITFISDLKSAGQNHVTISFRADALKYFIVTFPVSTILSLPHFCEMIDNCTCLWRTQKEWVYKICVHVWGSKYHSKC